MDTDNEIIIRRVTNGWIVQPYVFGPNAVRDDTIYIFETFESLVRWLDDHFTKPKEQAVIE